LDGVHLRLETLRGSKVYYLVVDGREEAIELKEESLTTAAWSRGRFGNRLQPHSLARIRRVLDVACSLEESRLTADLLAEADAGQDLKGGLGALRMLDVEGFVHSRSGGRRQLIWHPGGRERGEPPRLAEAERYRRLRALLRSRTDRWHSTDWLLVAADFDPDLELRWADESERRRGLTHGLPVNFFRDHGKSARKYLLGALKVLYWLECLAWRNHTPQAVEWRWVQPVKEKVVVPPVSQQPRSADPYLIDDPPPSRRERLTARAAERQLTFQGEAQRWIRDNYPEAAQRYEDEHRRRAEDVAKRRQAELREAAYWGTR
jgi:hypothetical protein